METDKITGQIENIKGILPILSPEAITALNEYVSFLLEKEKKHSVFVERLLEIEGSSDYLEFENPKELMDAIVNWKE
ncbi:hypothetical protein MBAV_002797 [Candidatus Magnetobacterium bavaricum]|uniref:DUF2281 domain-containing protein n=1 Tax=Candidatus Magnetobacterium bavaricum TaxID=29290 RepID=A0A0F3GT27_9BACT|nr:hypothetical protein MBAV_002797 [Candidatus Magnetobacterium bavaricum]